MIIPHIIESLFGSSEKAVEDQKGTMTLILI